jgi:peptidoglycan/LPS O-acetylase OafA/YrhL
VSRRSLLPYQPALDGLRGLALLAIVVFHAELPWAPGAFLSVSTFFTLSGFLITVLLLEEEHASGRVDLKAFWPRRLRRLLPASLATIALIVVLTAVLGSDDQVRSLRGDALASLLYVSNWRFIVTDASYGAIFESPSPFAHFWTLAIEEQYYLVFPAVLSGLLLVTRTARRWVVALFLVVAAVGSAAWAAYLFRHGATLDRVYYGTDTRIGELMVGGLLAVGWRRYRSTLARPSASRAVAVVGGVALVVMLALWTQASLTQTFWYQGGLTLYALLTCVVIVAAMNEGGPTRSILSIEPLAWIGLVSYGAYLWHWPILVWLDTHTNLDDKARFALGLALTLGAATLSARLVERPVLRGGNIGPLAPQWAAPLGVVAVGGLILATTAIVAPTDAPELARSADELTELTESGPDLDEDERAALRAAVDASTAPVVGVFGDSTALQTALGLVDWSYHNATVLRPGGGWSMQGCGLIPESERIIDGVPTSPPPECDSWLEGWRAEMERYEPDIAYVQVGNWEVFDTTLDGDQVLVLGEDPALDELVETRLADAVDLLLTEVPVVVLASSPDIEFGRQDGRSPSEPAPASDPARMARFREIIDAVAARHPDRVRVVDLAGYLESRGDDDARLRPDGIHFSADTASEVAEWLGPELAQMHLDVVGTDVGQDSRPPPSD